MSTKLINPSIKTNTMNQIKEYITSMIGQEVVFYEKRIHDNDRVYINPKKICIEKLYPSFFSGITSDGVKETITYVDLYCKDILIREVVS